MGTLKPDGTPWNLEDDYDFRLLKLWRGETVLVVRRSAMQRVLQDDGLEPVTHGPREVQEDDEVWATPSSEIMRFVPGPNEGRVIFSP